MANEAPLKGLNLGILIARAIQALALCVATSFYWAQ